jgi:hypothetical protein
MYRLNDQLVTGLLTLSIALDTAGLAPGLLEVAIR